MLNSCRRRLIIDYCAADAVSRLEFLPSGFQVRTDVDGIRTRAAAAEPDCHPKWLWRRPNSILIPTTIIAITAAPVSMDQLGK